MSFEEWFKQNTNETVNENTRYSKQFVKDAYEANQTKVESYRKALRDLVYAVRYNRNNEVALERFLINAEQLIKE